MRRLLVVIPLILFIFLNACGVPATPTPGFVIQTWTPTPDPADLYAIQSAYIFMRLNLAIEARETSDKFAELEHVTGASYQVTSVDFPLENNMSTPTVFQLESRCECARNAQCCSPTRTFVAIMMAMSDVMIADPSFNAMIPMTVTDMRMRIFDHTIEQDVITVPWENVKFFVFQPESYRGLELGARVTETVP